MLGNISDKINLLQTDKDVNFYSDSIADINIETQCKSQYKIKAFYWIKYDWRLRSNQLINQ